MCCYLVYLCLMEKKIILIGVGFYSDFEGGVFIVLLNIVSWYDDDGYNILE